MWITSRAPEVHDRIAVGVRRRAVERRHLVAVDVECHVGAEGHERQRAPCGDGSTRMLKNARNCSVDIRFRTLSCATISAPGLGEALVAARVVAVPVRVEDELHRLRRDRGDRGLDLRRERRVLVVDQEHGVGADREPQVAAGAGQHVDAVRDRLGPDLDLAEVPLGVRPAPMAQHARSRDASAAAACAWPVSLNSSARILRTAEAPRCTRGGAPDDRPCRRRLARMDA